MTDYNFFEIEGSKREKETIFRLVLILAGVVLALGLLSYPLINFFTMSRLGKEIETMKQVMASGNTEAVLNRVDEKNAQIEGLESTLALLTLADQSLHNNMTVDDSLLYELLSVLPQSISLQSLRFTAPVVQLEGRASNQEEIAQLEYNMRSNPFFKSVFIPSIEQQDSHYVFTLTFTQEDIFDEAH